MSTFSRTIEKHREQFRMGLACIAILQSPHATDNAREVAIEQLANTVTAIVILADQIADLKIEKND